MRRLFTVALVAASFAVPTTALAQNPYTDTIKSQLALIKNPVMRTAEKVPEDLYAFKPVPEVRSLGQLIAHIADGNFGLCGAATGMKPPMSGVEKSTQGNGKAALQKALAASFEFCEARLAAMDDKKGAEVIKFFLGTAPQKPDAAGQPRLGVLAFNNSHVNEHYGNLVTYMRLKGIVPPSSEPTK